MNCNPYESPLGIEYESPTLLDFLELLLVLVVNLVFTPVVVLAAVVLYPAWIAAALVRDPDAVSPWHCLAAGLWSGVLIHLARILF